MRKTKSILFFLFLFISLLAFQACEDDMDKHYETPDWLEGSTWDVLESKGNYETFLQGAELAGFDAILKGKAIVTVMAPDDDAFASYIKSDGKNSIEDYSTEELEKLIGYHILYYSYQKDDLINFQPTNDEHADEEAQETFAGLYYKFRSRSQEDPTTEIDSLGEEFTVYHNERLMPVFSYEMFNTKNIDATYNYEYFYQNSSWSGSNGFNASDATVDEYEIVADNGYIYMVDRVIEPLETIYEEMASRSDYSRYIDLYDQYVYYSLDEDLTTDFGDGTDLYLKHYDNLPDIGNEWPVSNYRNIATIAYGAYSIFAPSNSALENFFEEYWEPGGYTSLDDVNEVATRYLIYNTLYGASVVFPEEITNGDIENTFNVQISFNVDEVAAENRVMCSNGTFYGLSQLDIPPVFKSVTGPAFQNKSSYYYLYMLESSSLLDGMSSDETTLTTLIPSNEQMESYGISFIDDALWIESEGELSTMATSTMTSIVNLHTVTGGDEISTSGTQVLRTNNAYTYWYVKDGKLTTSVLYSDLFINPSNSVDFCSLSEYTLNGENWSNGHVYAYDAEEMFDVLNSSTSAQSKLAITRDETYPYYEFSELLRDAGLVNTTDQEITFLAGTRCLIFIPRNEVIKTAIANGKVPGVETDGTVSDTDTLASYLKSYFISTNLNGITAYPYPGSGLSGNFETLQENTVDGENQYTEIKIIDDGSSLKVQRIQPEQSEGDVINVTSDYDYFPFAFDDAGIHYIDGIL